MQEAREDTVLGDFKNATFDLRGKRWRFFRRDGKFAVSAEDPEGALHDYDVVYTFGVDPLQQYLVSFPGGRKQPLPVAWATREKRWFFLYPGKDIPPTDWLHWTRQGQNWNSMCADCHSTNVTKGYDSGTNTFRTTWSELAVGCEACHGPGSLHVDWARLSASAREKRKDRGLVARTVSVPNQAQVELCASCHSRRAQFADQGTPGAPFLDRYLPVLLSPGLFYADGQILDEDFEFHSFTQSKMYAQGVSCTHCHDPHSAHLYAEGNALCTRCHAAGVYDGPGHHFHEAVVAGKPNPGALCVSCHMPGKDYMVVHFRRDHSLRIPRPDLSALTGAPNACAGCHADKTSKWLQEKYAAWFGKGARPEIGTTLSLGRAHSPLAEPGLLSLAGDESRPAITRATALSLVSDCTDEPSVAAIEHALEDADPLIRATAVTYLRPATPEALVHDLGPLLRDPIRAVRAEAAARLAEVPEGLRPEAQRPMYERALEEYVAWQTYMSDMPSGPYNLGNLFAHQGRLAEAEKRYRRALTIDDQFYMAKLNLALLVDQEGHPEEAVRLLQEVKRAVPQEDAVVDFNLGLALAEEHDDEGAEKALRAALAADPALAPAAYNLAVLVGKNRPAEAVELLRRTLELRPGDLRYQRTLAFYLSTLRGFRRPAH
jgi:predicted CXXCH cytochrome family protein